MRLSKRNWGVLVFALGLVLVGEAKAQDSTNSLAGERGGSTGATVRTSPTYPPLRIQIVEEPAEAQRAQSRENDADQRERDDLTAQQSMAKSTEQIVVLSWFQIWLSGFGTVVAALGTAGLIYSLVLNRRATNAAVKAAEAAEKAVGLERAWLLIGGMKAGDFKNGYLDDLPIANGFFALLSFKNFGRTPALQVNVFRYHRLVPSGSPPPHFEIEDTSERINGILGPGMGVEAQMIILNDEEARNFENRESDLYVFVRLSYRDIFSETERITIYCAQIMHGGEVSIGGDKSYTDWILRVCGSQNTVT